MKTVLIVGNAGIIGLTLIGAMKKIQSLKYTYRRVLTTEP